MNTQKDQTPAFPEFSELHTILSLSVPLPADVSRLIQAGCLKEAQERIRFLLSVPSVREEPMQKARLELELVRLSRLPEEYPYTLSDALSLIRRQIPDFSGEEFDALERNGRIDFIFIDGQKRYFHRFWETLTSTDAVLAGRADPRLAEEAASRSLFRNKTIQLLKENGSLKYRIHLKAGLRIRDEFFEPGKEILVHLPVPKESAPTCNVRILNTGHRPAFLSPADAPARTVAFREIPEENDTFWVEYEYDSIVRYVELNPDLVSDSLPDFDTGQLLPHIRFTPYLRSLTARVAGRETNPLIRAKKIYDFITTRVKYSYMPEYLLLDDIAESCAVNRRGDCGVQALLFITMCRIAGIPARWQSGLSVTPVSVGPHDWAQFFIPYYGWLYADPSFGGSAFRAGETERHAFYFGNLDPFRMVANTDFQAPLFPPISGLRADPYDNQVGECEIGGKGLLSGQFDYFHEIIDVRSIRRG